MSKSILFITIFLHGMRQFLLLADQYRITLPWESESCRNRPDYEPAKTRKGSKFPERQPPMKYMACDLGSPNFMAWGQRNEDTKIWRRFFRDKSYVNNGFFLEMGGLDGMTFSNTFIYEHCLGWKGMLIEANEANFVELVKNRPCTHNVWSAACPRGQSHLFMTDRKGISEIVNVNSSSSQMGVKMVPCRSLRSIFSEYNITKIDFFSLDVEGAEAAVLSTINFRKVTIGVLIAERSKLGDESEASREKNNQVERIMKRAGMIKMPTDGNLVPACQREKKGLTPGQATFWDSDIYVHPSLRDDICQ